MDQADAFGIQSRVWARAEDGSTDPAGAAGNWRDLDGQVPQGHGNRATAARVSGPMSAAGSGTKYTPSMGNAVAILASAACQSRADALAQRHCPGNGAAVSPGAGSWSANAMGQLLELRHHQPQLLLTVPAAAAGSLPHGARTLASKAHEPLQPLLGPSGGTLTQLAPTGRRITGSKTPGTRLGGTRLVMRRGRFLTLWRSFSHGRHALPQYPKLVAQRATQLLLKRQFITHGAQRSLKMRDSDFQFGDTLCV